MAQIDVRIKTRRVYGSQGGVPSIIKNVNSNSARLTYNYARAVQKYAKQKVHVITGHLRDSIKRERLGYAKHRVIVGAYYGIYEEYGTRYRPPHPYFRPAVRLATVQFHQDIRRVFQG